MAFGVTKVMFSITTALNKIHACDKKIVGIQGGTSAGKTIDQLMLEIDFAIKNPLTETSIVAESVPHLRRGALRDFKKIMMSTNRWNDKNWKVGESKYEFTNKSWIEFFSADDDSKLRGARRDRLFMNEANNMKFKVYTELASRTKQKVTMDWNPTERFWFHDELLNDDDVDFIILTYMDNEECPDSARDFILKAKKKAETSSFWENWYRVYGLGQEGVLQDVIFNDWLPIKDIPSDARLLGYGMDFGYTNDPTTMIALYEWRQEGKITHVWDQCIYQTGLLNSDIYDLAKGFTRSLIVADSAEPKSIAELRRRGLNIMPAKKGSDSIRHGIGLLQQNPMYVTERSVDLIKELRTYAWMEKDGVKSNKPVDAFNHAIDGMRYIAEKRITKRKITSIRV